MKYRIIQKFKEGERLNFDKASEIQFQWEKNNNTPLNGSITFCKKKSMIQLSHEKVRKKGNISTILELFFFTLCPIFSGNQHHVVILKILSHSFVIC